MNVLVRFRNLIIPASGLLHKLLNMSSSLEHTVLRSVPCVAGHGPGLGRVDSKFLAKSS